MKYLLISIICAMFCVAQANAQTPLEVPLDLIARSTAKTIYAKNDPYTIGTAFYDAYFTVLMNDGNHRKGKNGLYVHEWNLNIMALAMKKNVSVRLKDFILAWQLAAMAKKSVIQDATVSPELIAKFIADLKLAVNLPKEEISGRRQLAQVVVALGRQNPLTPYDLLADNVSPDVPLNAVQMGLLTQKMSADLWIKAHKEHAQPLITNNKSLTRGLDFSESSCVLTDTEGLIFDATAAYSGLLVGGFYEFLGSAKFISETGVERFGKITGVANIVLSYVKFAWSLAAFDAKLVASKNPLERTKTRIAGEDVDILGSFQMDGSSLQIVNCLRPALNAAGIDFSLPQGGPLAGVLVEWEIATRVGSDNDVIQTVGSDPRHQETDNEGRNKITVQGKPQKKNLSPDKIVAVDRIVPIIATVNLKNKNPAQDMVDLFSLTGGASNFFTQPLEILNRAPLLFSGKLNLEVRDFKELEGDLFQIEAEYVTPMEQESGSNAWLKNIKDGFVINTEVKVINNKVTAELLTLVDGKSQYLSDYPATYIDGEGCKVEQAAVGDYEAFLLSKNALEIKGSITSEPDRSTYAEVSVKIKGSKKLRGFNYKYQSPCPTENIPVSVIENSEELNLTFSSKQLNQIGKSITIDRRSNGQGWLFKVTYLK
jgi:hypothetical protein